MKTISTTLAFVFILFISSCNKGGTDSPPVTPPVVKADTLPSRWKKITVDTADKYVDIFFNNNTTGYLLGAQAALKSTDGGLTWNVIKNTFYENEAVTSDGKLFLVGGNNIFRSTNGGTTITNYSVASWARDIFFTDNQNGYCITYNELYNTIDGGTTWNKVNTTGLSFAPGYYSKIYFASNTIGYAVTYNGVYKSNGSLTNWTASSYTGTTSSFFSVFATPNNNVYIANFKQLYKSTDGGATFSQIKVFSNDANSFVDIHFVDNNVGYVCVGNRIYKTTDAGATWNVEVALGDASIMELHFTDANHGWACGTKGTVLVFN